MMNKGSFSQDRISLGTLLSELQPPYKIDLDRLVWDPEYRQDIRHQMKRGAL